MKTNNLQPQKKYLKEKRKQLRVSVDLEKYELFKSTVHSNHDSIYRLINDYIDNYLKDKGAL